MPYPRFSSVAPGQRFHQLTPGRLQLQCKSSLLSDPKLSWEDAERGAFPTYSHKAIDTSSLLFSPALDSSTHSKASVLIALLELALVKVTKDPPSVEYQDDVFPLLLLTSQQHSGPLLFLGTVPFLAPVPTLSLLSCSPR